MNIIKKYFAEEVDRLAVPAFPEDLSRSLKPARRQDRQDRFQWRDTLAVAACLAFVIMILARPASFDTPVRNLSISPERLDEVKGNISRVLHEAAAAM